MENGEWKIERFKFMIFFSPQIARITRMSFPLDAGYNESHCKIENEKDSNYTD